LRVGPRSAGAQPGPAGYGLGGEQATVTDANLALGRLADEAVLGGEVVLKQDLAERALASLGASQGMDVHEAALGVVRVANAEMVRALRVISVERGIDPRDLALVAFGGAGPMHCCELADELGVRTVLVPRACGVLSALGLALADVRRDYVTSFLAAVDDTDFDELRVGFEELERRARKDVAGARVRRRADLRYRGQSFELTVEADELDELIERFHATHEGRYGYAMEDERVELVNLRLVATAPVAKPSLREPPARSEARPTDRRVSFDGGWMQVPVLRRTELGSGSELTGPAIIEFAESTCMLPPRWSGTVDDAGSLILRADHD
jgi:N-methylhydantoinase A